MYMMFRCNRGAAFSTVCAIVFVVQIQCKYGLVSLCCELAKCVFIILTTNLAAVVCVCQCVWMCVSVQHLTNFCPHALISNPNVPKIVFA